MQGRSRLLRISHHRNQQVRNAVINAQLHHLGIDHNHLHVIRVRLKQNPHNDRIDTNRLTGAGRSRDQQMGHLRNIRKHGFAADILTHRKDQIGGKFIKLRRFHQIAERHRRVLLVRHLDAHRRFPGNGRFDTNIRGCQIQLDVVRKPDDFADLDALLRLQFIAGDGRPPAVLRDAHLHAEIAQNLFQALCRLLELPVGIRALLFLPRRQKVRRRKTVAIPPAPSGRNCCPLRLHRRLTHRCRPCPAARYRHLVARHGLVRIHRLFRLHRRQNRLLFLLHGRRHLLPADMNFVKVIGFLLYVMVRMRFPLSCRRQFFPLLLVVI